MVYAIQHRDSDLEAIARNSSAAVVPVQRHRFFFGMLKRGGAALQLQKYQQPPPAQSQRHRSSATEAHKAMVQRFQLRRVSTGSMDPEHGGGGGSASLRRHSSLILSSFTNLTQRAPATLRCTFWRCALKNAQHRLVSAARRLQQPIAPDGKLQQMRELTLLLAFALQIVYFPFVAVFIRDSASKYASKYASTQLHVAFESVFVLDLLLAFNTAFYSKDGATLVVSRAQIMHRYLRSWFVVDLLAAIPLDSIAILSHADGSSSSGSQDGGFVTVLLTRIPKLVHQLNLSPVFSAARAIRVTRQFWTWVQYSRYSHLLRIGKLIVGVLATAHYMACTWELLKSPSVSPAAGSESPFVRYVDNFYYSMLLLQGEATDASLGSMAQNAYNIGAIMLGSLVLAVVFGNVAMLVANFYANATNYQRKMESVFDTMNKMQLPHELRDRIHQYYDHLWREYECLDGDIVQFSRRLTHSLELEVGLFKYMELVVNIPFWKECSPDFITQIVLNLDVRVYLPDDYVIRKGETGEQLFIINKGKCELVQFIKPRNSSTESTGGGGGGSGPGGFGSTSGKPTSSTSSFQNDDVSDSEEEEENRRTQAESAAEEEQTYYHFRQGESFGELALLMNYRRTASVRAVSYVEMCILNRKNFQNVLFKYPGDRRKVLLMMLKQCIKNNLLKDIPYPWKELVGPNSASRGVSASPGRSFATASGTSRKFSRSSRRVTMFGDTWTVNEVAAVLVDKIDGEHRDESIVFGFQAADLKPKPKTASQDSQQRGSSAAPVSGLPRSSRDLPAEARATPAAVVALTPPLETAPHQLVTPEDPSAVQQQTSLAARLDEPLGSPHAESSDRTDTQPLFEITVAEDAVRRSKRRRRASSIGNAGASELQQQEQTAEAVAALLAQMESVSARLGRAEAVQTKVTSALSALTVSIQQLDALTTDAIVSCSAQSHGVAIPSGDSDPPRLPRPLEARERAAAPSPARSSPSFQRSREAFTQQSTRYEQQQQTLRQHRRSVAGHEFRRRRSSSSSTAGAHHLKRAMTHGMQSIFTNSQRPFREKHPSAAGEQQGDGQQRIDQRADSMRANA